MPTQSDGRIARQTAWLAAVAAVQLLGGLAQVFVATRILGPAGYGALAVVMATAALVHGLAAIPGSDTITTFATRGIVEGRPREAAAITRFAVFVSLGLSLVAYLIITALAYFASDFVVHGQTDAAALQLYAVVGVFVASNAAAISVLRLADRMGAVFALACLENLVRLCLLGFVWRGGGGILGVVSASVAAAVVSGSGLLTVAAVYSTRTGMEGAWLSLSVRVPRDVRWFHSATFGRTILGAIGQNLDTIVLAQFVDEAHVGLYRAARQIVDVARQPFRMLRAVVHPVMSRLWYDGQGQRLRLTVGRYTGISVAIAGVGFGALAAMREPVTVVLFGAQFRDAAGLIAILIPGAFVTSLAVLGTVPVAVGRAFPPLVSQTVGLVAWGVAVALLVPALGVAGGAWARTTLAVVSFLVLLPFICSALLRAKHL